MRSPLRRSPAARRPWAIADQLVVSGASFPATLLVGRTIPQRLVNIAVSIVALVLAVQNALADLAMFKAATRSFAPANIGSRNAAQLLGCEIVSEP